MLNEYNFKIKEIYFNASFIDDKLCKLNFSYNSFKKLNFDSNNKYLLLLKLKLDSYLNSKKEDFKEILFDYGPISNFRKKLYDSLLDIKYGSLISYKDLALKGFKSAKYTRAVAMCLAKNKLPLIIPCHRVICSDNSLSSYNAGVDFKKYFLKLENSYSLIE